MGIQYHAHQSVQDPDEFYRQYKVEFSETMKEKLDDAEQEARIRSVKNSSDVPIPFADVCCPVHHAVVGTLRLYG